MINDRQVVVIGAGLTGLACAYRLKTLGIDTLLIEASSRAGGVIQSESIDGFLIERGPNSSQGTEEFLALVDELGIMDELVEGDPKAPAYVYFRGRLHPVPSGPGAFIKSKLLSARGKLRILAEPFIPARRDPEEETVASFVRRRLGEEAAQRLVAPFVSGIYAGDFERLSVQAAFPRLANLETGYGGLIRGAIAKAFEARRAKKSASAVMDKAAPTRRRLVSFRTGMGFLPQTLSAGLGEDLLTGCSDVRLGIRDRGWEVTFKRSGAAEEVICEHVVVATPAWVAASLVAPVSDELRALLGEIPYPPLAIVYLAYDVSAIKTPLDGFGFLAAPSEGLGILGCVWNSSLFPGRAPEGESLLTVFIGGALNPDAARAGDSELASIAHIELQKVLGITGSQHVVAVTRYERAIPQYNLGHAARVRDIEKLAGELRGLSITGNYVHGVSTGDCVKEADRVAREVSARVGR
jgi:oxygen-dependent protoporphyrinogen oxidase